MILADTSVWVHHLRYSDRDLARMLDRNEVLVHPFVVGELALGSLQNRARLIGSLQRLPEATVASNAEVLDFIDQGKLHGLGIGYVDAHLLASARLTPPARLWSRDRRLAAAAAKLGLYAN